MKKYKNIYLCLLFWSLGVAGFLGVLLCMITFFKFVFFNNVIIAHRLFLGFIISIGLCFLGLKYTKKYE